MDEVCATRRYRVTTPLKGDLFVGTHSRVIRHGHPRSLKVNKVKRVFALFENLRQFWTHEFLVFQSPVQLNGLSLTDLSSKVVLGNVTNATQPLCNHVCGDLPLHSKHINPIKIQQMR